MAEKRRFFDVWIIEGNTVYREVPFQVVADWVQQGRLLEDDKLRPSGTAEWFRIGGSPEFTPYLPRPEPFRADDQAEALEPVELEFRYKKRPDDEDDDVDMIPLIDVSLVLLIFFMLTASGVASVFVPTPEAEHGHIANNPEEVALEINNTGPEDEPRPIFSMRIGNHPPEKDNKDLETMAELLARLDAYLKPLPQRVEVSINAHPDVRAGIVRDLMSKLEAEPFRSRIKAKFIGVHEKP